MNPQHSQHLPVNSRWCATAVRLVWTLHRFAVQQKAAVIGVGVIGMAMDGSEIERLIREAFPDAEVVIVDLAGDGDHFAARVTSDAFRGKSRIQQHKMVYNALAERMGSVLHALALETSPRL